MANATELTLPQSGPRQDLDAGPSGARAQRASSAIVAAVVIVLIISAAVRLYQLQIPRTLVFDETYYAKDANSILHAYLGANPGYPWEPGKEISWPHPEYGKMAIAIGVGLFGNASFGWRIAPAIAGTILLALVYPVGRRLGLPPPWALLALILAASDFLGIVQSRIATLDVFVGLWSVLCIYLALRYVQTGHRLVWLFVCGIAGGLAFGTKWSGAFAIVAAAAIMLLYRRRSWRQPPRTAALQALRDVALPVVALLVVPVALYFASYTIYFVKGKHTLGQWWALQHEMWWFNQHLHATHTYASRAWTWIFDYRPVWYFYEQRGGVHGIISMGNPFLWWASVGALAALVILGIVRRRRDEFVLPLIVALLYLPWLSTTRTSFMYYLTPVAPFLALAVARILGELAGWRLPRPVWAANCFAASAVVVAVLWYQLGQAAKAVFWTVPSHASLDLARLVVVLVIAVAAGGFVGLIFWHRARTWWPYLAWVFTGAVAGICIAYLPILIDLSISVSHFYHLMWFRSWI
jgi:dolichyl-phosphate-mannose--protein O-mannosyl transferase